MYSGTTTILLPAAFAAEAVSREASNSGAVLPMPSQRFFKGPVLVTNVSQYLTFP